MGRHQVTQFKQGDGQRGFTLLEILLVIVMIAVTSAMIVPSLDIGGASLKEEAKRLQSTLRFALDEAQMSGQPLRWVATKHTWYFEVLEQDEASKNAAQLGLDTGALQLVPEYTWQPYGEAPLNAYVLPAPVRIDEVKQAVTFDLGVTVKPAAEGRAPDGEPVVGMVLLLPDGTTSPSDIVLSNEDVKEEKPVVVRVRPGPAGIRVLSENELP